MKRKLYETAALRAPWMTLLCSASDGGEGEGGEGGGGGSGGDDEPLKRVLAKNDELLNEVKSAKAKLRELEAAEAERKAEAAKREEEEARAKGEWEKIENGYKQKLADLEGDQMLWKGKFYELKMDLSLTGALDEINVKPELRKAAMALLRNNADIDDDGNVTVEDKPLSDYIKTWAKSDEGKAFILNGSAGGGANGSGKNTGGDKNPWAKDSWNLTEQGRIYKADPNRARDLARAAGAVPPA